MRRAKSILLTCLVLSLIVVSLLSYEIYQLWAEPMLAQTSNPDHNYCR